MDDTELFRVPFVEAPGVYQTTTCLGDERIEAEKI